MAVCVVSYVIWAVLYRKREILPFPKKLLYVFLLANTIAMILFGVQRMGEKQLTVVPRTEYGEGSVKETYLATVGEDEIAVEVEVAERRYTPEEEQQIMAEVIQALDRIIIGENKSFDHVDTDLQLVTEVEDYPVQIQWLISNYQVVNLDGTIQNDYQEENGTLIELQAQIMCQESEAVYTRSVRVYPKKKKAHSKEEQLRALVREAEEKSGHEKELPLPKELEGEKIVWRKARKNTGYIVWIGGVLITVLLVLREKEKKRERQKQREEELLQDYPKMIHTFTLLLETGMTAKTAWAKMVQNYEQQKERRGIRVAYEEMGEAYRRMSSGMSEAEAYEKFGSQCTLPQYRRFAILLSRNLRKGSKGLADLLVMEAIQAREEQKSRMKQKAEEAGTKLLLPMFGMLGVVLIMVIVPAFWTLQ